MGEKDHSVRGSAFSVRAFLIGVLLCAFISTATIYSNTIIRGTFMAWSFSNPVALFLLFYLVMANILLGALSKRLALRREELVLIYVMMIVSASLPTFGLVEHLLPMITGVFYFATPENGWAELIHHFVPQWIAPRDEYVVTGFYEGLPQGAAIPWWGWVESLSYWFVFLISLHVVSICMMVMLRRQWVERERLLYPMIHAPLEMVQEGEDGRFSLAPLFRRPMMWVGFALPILVGSLNALHNYYPGVPSVQLSGSLSLMRNMVHIPFTFSFSLIGFSYFISRNLALGIWLFYILTIFEQGIFDVVGISSTEKLGWFSNPRSPYLTHQSIGAMLTFALFTLWKAREHIVDVVRKAFVGDDRVRDDDEIMSYRAAVLGFLGGLAVMLVWLNAAGIPLWVVPLFLTVALLIFLALSRIVSEGGVALVRAPLIAPDFIMASVGPANLGGGGLTGLAYTYPWTADIVTFPMASVANGLKMANEAVPGRKRGLLWGILAAIVVTLLGSFWIMLYLSYKYGGINLHSWFWQTSSLVPMSYLALMLRSPSSTDLGGWFFTFLGSGLMMGMITLHHRVLWWPVHPLGLAMSGTVFTSGVMWFNVFLGWLIKGVVLRYGGGKLYRDTRFFFIGMILGAFVVAGTWLVIDYFTGQQGNFTLVW